MRRQSERWLGHLWWGYDLDYWGQKKGRAIQNAWYEHDIVFQDAMENKQKGIVVYPMR